MKFRGIRFKLTVWYALAFSVAGSLVFLSFYFLTKQALYFQTDTTLSAHGLKVTEVALRQSEGMHDELSRQAFLSEFSKIPGMLVAIGDDKGQIISTSLAGKENDTLISSTMKEFSRNDKEPVLVSRRLGTSLLRLWISPVVNNGRLVGVIVVGHPIDVIENSLSALLSAMGLVYASLVMLTTFGGYFLAKKATKPINEITDKIIKITSENLAERIRVPKTGDEIEKLSISFNDLLDRLDSAFRRERQFIGDLAHELKTPLATLMGEIELALARKRGAAQYRQALDESLTDARKLSETLTNVLDLDWSKTDIQMEKVNLSTLVSDLVEVASKLAIPKKNKVKRNIAKRIFVLGRKDKLSRAILNLIDNAIKFSPNKGEVIIYLGKEKGGVAVKISDNGGRIKRADRPHIFNRFYRGKNTDTSGSGLGLPIALAIVNAHKGKLAIESKKGKGTKAAIFLPVT